MIPFITTKAAEVPVSSIAEVICECFNRAPWNEEWTQESAEALVRLLCTKPFVLTYLASDEGIVESFAFGYSLQVADHRDDVVESGATPSGYYITAIATRPSARRRGAAKLLIKTHLDLASSMRYPALSLRTRVDNHALFGILVSLGFKRLPKEHAAVTGNVSSLRVVFERDTLPQVRVAETTLAEMGW